MARRDNGEGTVYKQVTLDPKTGRELVRWRAAVTVGLTQAGKPRRRYVSAPTKTAAKEALQKLRSDLYEGRLAAAPGGTVAAWLEHWLDTIMKPPRVTPNTWSGYRTMVRHWAIPHFGRRLRLEHLQPEHLESLYEKMRQAGRAKKTIQLCHRVLSSALETARKRGRTGRNVADLVEWFDGRGDWGDDEVEPLTVEECQLVLAAAAQPGVRNRARWSVALALGMRQGEVLGLTWDDVDLDARLLTVRWQLQRIPGQGRQLVPVKSRSGKRTIGLPPTLAAAMREHRAQQRAERMREGPAWVGWRTEVPHESGNWQDVALVFPQHTGAPIDRRDDWEAWKQLLLAAGVKPRSTPASRAKAARARGAGPAAAGEADAQAAGRAPRSKSKEARAEREADYSLLPPPHAARHTCATLLLLQGVDARVVMKILGWSKISMVERYQHVVDELVRAAAGAMESALFTDPTTPPTREAASAY